MSWLGRRSRSAPTTSRIARLKAMAEAPRGRGFLACRLGYSKTLHGSRSAHLTDPACSRRRQAPGWSTDEERPIASFPRAQLRSEVGRALGLPTPTHPTTDALEELLRSLQASFPVLADASDSVRTTARWALTSLNRRLRQSSDRETSFSFPVETDGEPSWDPAHLPTTCPADCRSQGSLAFRLRTTH